MSNDIQQKMVKGAVWMVLFKFMERGLGVFSTLILVRLLAPTDFGIVAMATAFIVMAELFTAFGFDIALIQKQDATDEHYHTAWTCNLILGVLIATLMLLVAGPISEFYKQPDVFWVVCALAFGPLITASENIGVVTFRKEMQFQREFVYQLSRKVIGLLVVIPLAFYMRNYWALVAGMLSSKLGGAIFSYVVHPFRPRFSLSKFRDLLRFSKWLVLNNGVIFLKDRSSDFLIGRLNGAAALGVYNVSYEFASMPMTELSAPINRALLPGFARLANNAAAMRETYSNALGILAMGAVPAAAGIFAVAPFLAPVVLGQKWLDTVPLLEILAFNGGLMLFQSSMCTVLFANGHPNRVMKTNAMYVVILLSLFGLLVPRFGITGAACALLATSALAMPLYLYHTSESIGVGPSVFFRAAARPIVAALFMAALVRWVLPDWDAAMSTAECVGWLAGGLVLGVVTYVIVIALLWFASGRLKGAESALIETLQARLGKRRGQPISPLENLSGSSVVND